MSKDTELHQRIMQRLLTSLRKDAASARDSAAFNGERHDGGAQQIEALCNAYEAGMRGKCPSQWADRYRDIAQIIAAEQDPEYAEYTRLRSRFEKNA